MSNVLYVTHPQAQCGVWNFGDRIREGFEKYSTKYNVTCLPCGDLQTFEDAVDSTYPSLILCNYYPLTIPWYDEDTYRSLSDLEIKTLGICHEPHQIPMMQQKFDKVITLDPLQRPNDDLFVIVEGIPDYTPHLDPPSQLTIGNFGFGQPGKGRSMVIHRVQEEFDEAIIRMHLPSALYADGDGSQARERIKECQDLIYKPGIKLEFDFDYLDNQGLLDWLASNSMNCFFYDYRDTGEIAGTSFWALAARRPIAINTSGTFSHLHVRGIRVEGTPLTKILENGIAPWEHYLEEWSMPNIISKYEEAITTTLGV